MMLHLHDMETFRTSDVRWFRPGEDLHDLIARAAATMPHLSTLVTEEPTRTREMVRSAAGVTMDFARQRISKTVLGLLYRVAEMANVEGFRDSMLRGAQVNVTEGRPALHVALRSADNTSYSPECCAEALKEYDRFTKFAESIRRGELKGSTGQAITAVVNLGIGGSDVGPRLVVEALAPKGSPIVRFVSCPDGFELDNTLCDLRPETTLFLVSSKSFRTEETLFNAKIAMQWLKRGGITNTKAYESHLVAITANQELAVEFGVPTERIFHLWNWVGGRFSLWSAIGLPAAITLGPPQFAELLRGARDMDHHFATAPISENLPILAALLAVWNRNFLGIPATLVAPYCSPLRRLTSYVQQLDMESNGKNTLATGNACLHETGPIIWGGLGTDGQHAYFQHAHQGTCSTTAEFIGIATHNSLSQATDDALKLMNANLLAQAEVLALGAQFKDSYPPANRRINGATPVTLLWLDQLSPYCLGALLAFYEHKVTMQGALWGINPFDQFGVEYGKLASREIQEVFYGQMQSHHLHPVTRATAERFLVP